MEGRSVHTLCGLRESLRDIQRKLMEYHEKLWDILQKMVRVIADIYEDFECAVIDGGETLDWFKIKSGVKLECVMSGFLFLLTLD